MQYIIHIKAYIACFTKVDIMLLKLQYARSNKFNEWLESLFNTQNV